MCMFSLLQFCKMVMSTTSKCQDSSLKRLEKNERKQRRAAARKSESFLFEVLFHYSQFWQTGQYVYIALPLHRKVDLYFTLLYFTLLYFTLLYFTLLYFTFNTLLQRCYGTEPGHRSKLNPVLLFVKWMCGQGTEGVAETEKTINRLLKVTLPLPVLI